MADKVKGIRLPEESAQLAKEMYAESGYTNEGEFFSSLIEMAQLKVGKIEPAVVSDLKEFEKLANRFYFLFLNMLIRSKDAIEEHAKGHSIEIENKSIELEALRDENQTLQKQLLKKEEELSSKDSIISDYQGKMISLEKTVKALEDLNHMTNEKSEQFELRIEELVKFEKEVQELNVQLSNTKKFLEQELDRHMEDETRLQQQLADQKKECERWKMKYKEEKEKLQKDHERELDMTRKEIEMEAKNTLLSEKSKWQEIKAQELREQSEHYNLKIAELLERMRDKK